MKVAKSSTVTRTTTLSPLRYPGGKAKLSAFIQRIFEDNALIGAHYAEPYAGGAGVGLSLLALDYVSQIHLNDIDPSVYAFWRSVLIYPEELCKLVTDTRATIHEWRKQKEIQAAPDRHSLIELGFSTLFLNRTNRSGIIRGGGVIGGLHQTGPWKLNARYYKSTIKKRIQWIATQAKRITLHNLDAETFLLSIANQYENDRIFIYLDPPYYIKGHRLYENHYSHEDHARVAGLIQTQLTNSWVVSYDDHSNVRTFYKKCAAKAYRLQYTAAKRSRGREVMFFSSDLKIPSVSPISLSRV